MVFVLMLISTLVLFTAEGLHPGVLAHEPWDAAWASPCSNPSRPAPPGFTPMSPLKQLSPAGQLMLMVVMFIGAAPASMGGGITTGTAVVLLVALWSYARNRPYPEVGGRTISTHRPAGHRRADHLAGGGHLRHHAAAAQRPSLTLDGALFEVVSAFATCGLSLAYTPRLGSFGRVLIILVMIWGRLGPAGRADSGRSP
jgi:trk system potassium uptake protein